MDEASFEVAFDEEEHVEEIIIVEEIKEKMRRLFKRMKMVIDEGEGDLEDKEEEVIEEDKEEEYIT